MQTIKRLFRHLFTTTATGRRAFSSSTLKAIQTAIAHGEKEHRAEIRLIIEPSLPLSIVWAGLSSRERARILFAQYRIWDTEENCGILIYINLADHKVEIIADRTTGRLLASHEWKDICKAMTDGFALGKFHDSALKGIQQLNEVLASRFPFDGPHSNELSNRPLIL
jgi:uncharacterized membrane protein